MDFANCARLFPFLLPAHTRSDTTPYRSEHEETLIVRGASPYMGRSTMHEADAQSKWAAVCICMGRESVCVDRPTTGYCNISTVNKQQVNTHASSTQAAIRRAVNGFFAHATSLLRAAGRTRIVDEVEGSTSCALVCSISVYTLNIYVAKYC
jgi:hypothetical protein